MSDLSRREVVGILGLVTATGAFGCTTGEVERAAQKASAAAAPYKPGFFTPEEWQTVKVLADIILPKDERSGSATDAGVPQFMDFMMQDRPDSQPRMRLGLAWFNREAQSRFQVAFPDAKPEQQLAIVNDVAWPEKAKATEALKEPADFFSNFRNLTASGFFSSRMGVEDLGYKGNVFNAKWDGCPQPQLDKLGVSYT
ncbi:MAG TPA: gluconate 2-dehydrogenase subunit 3 family protein [Gemmatimonadales bacterium]|nr:gluconate 2-dehydrogenase subunit 3 family protein [Gemmatimonadales bacterium]